MLFSEGAKTPGSMARRTLLAGALGFSAVACATRGQAFLASRSVVLGAQTYTVADAVRADLGESFDRIAAIGYRHLELGGYHGHAPAAIRAAADRAGLRIASIQTPSFPMDGAPGLAGDLAPLIADLRTLGVRYAVMPLMLPPEGARQAAGEDAAAFFTRVMGSLKADDWKRTAAFLNDRGAVLKREGVALGYHNHTFEFLGQGSETGWNILMRETDPELVTFELDVGWAVAAGADPMALIREARGRIRLMHIKDLIPVSDGSFGLPVKFVQVGAGVIDWPALIPAAYRAGVRDLFVEQEPPFEIDRFEALAQSYRYLTTKV